MSAWGDHHNQQQNFNTIRENRSATNPFNGEVNSSPRSLVTGGNSKGMTNPNIAQLKNTLVNLQNEKQSLQNELQRNPHDENLKIELQIVSNNIDTVSQKISKLM